MKRTEYVLYALVLREHPETVKVGRTTSWKNRKNSYETWNFAAGDGILKGVKFIINEEYCCLPGLESECLSRMNKPVKKGSEWFKASLEHASEIIRRVLIENALSCIEEDL